MPDKLTDSEIKKALECISGEAKDWDCDKCAFDGAICTSFVAEKALDLINRLQAENDKLQTVKKHIDTLIHRGVEYPTAEAYEQAFKKALEQLYDNTNAEEKLQQILPVLDELKGDIKHDINLAKAEAYKECITRVEDRLSRKLSPELLKYIHDDLQDELKKMVGGNDGNA